MKLKKKIVLLPGDGIGPEVTQAAASVLQECAREFQHHFEMVELPVGGSAIEKTGNPLPNETLDACRKADAIFLGAVGGPKWDALPVGKRPESGLLDLRRGLGLYVNLRGREKNGIVADGTRRAELLRSISERLLALRDPRDGATVVDAVYDPRKVFRGHALESAPDLIIGYAAGYRGSWQTALGGTPESVLEDNNDAWIGDHCIDRRRVPGALLASRPIPLADPDLRDITVTILKEFGVSPNDEMQGRSIF